MKKVTTFLNGKKLIIGQALIIVLMLFQDKLSAEVFNALMSLVVLFTEIGAAHKVKKAVSKK